MTGEAKDALRLKMLSIVVDQSPVSVVVTSPDGIIEYVNAHFTVATGYGAEEVIGENPRILSSGETPPETYQTLWATITAGRRWTGELRNRRKDGELRWEEVIIAPVFIDEGRLVYYVAIKEDVTERRLLQDRLSQTNSELEQFAYVVSHDLRQPLRMVNNYLQLTERRLKDTLDDDTRQFMAFARDGAVRMDHLILDLLEYSRIGRGSSADEAASVAYAAEDAVQNLGVAISEAKAEVIIAPDLPTIRGNLSDLVRLFQNLIGNAVKYRTPDRPPVVSVTCRRAGNAWIVSVRDNGIGIPADQRDRVFGVFQRLHTTEQYEGTGIGLAVCRKIVEHHGGHIWVEPVEGPGTDFRFSLPAEGPQPGDAEEKLPC